MENINNRSKINNLKLEEIFELIGNMLSDTDIIYFCNDEKVVNEYLELYDYKKNNLKEIQEFLMANEDKIDKEKLVFAIYLNYKINLEVINRKIDILSSNVPENTKELYRYIQQNEMKSKFMKKAEGLLKDTDVYILKVKLDNNRLYSYIYSSKEIIQNRKKSETRNLEIIKQIDEDLSNNGDGSIYLLQVLILTDLKYILPDEQAGIELRECILNNAVYDKGEYDIKQLNNIKDIDDDQYTEIIDNIEPKYFLPELREEVIRNIRFVAIDKMLLLIAYRFEEYLEDIDDIQMEPNLIKNLILYVQSKIKNKDISFDEELEKRVTYEPIQVKYTYKDLEKFSRRIVGDSYIKKSEIENVRQSLKTGKLTLDEVEGPLCGLLDLEDNDFEEIMHYSDENFVYAVELLSLKQEQILSKFRQYPNSVTMAVVSYLYDDKKINFQALIDLYSEGLISGEFFKKFSEENDISSEINLSKINEQYFLLKKQEEIKQEDVDKLNKMIELYKLLNIDEKTSEELEELSDEVMYEIAEDFEDEEDILFYYMQGLVTLRTVAEWSGEKVIQKLYDESKINFEDLEKLYKSNKIEINLIQKNISLEGIDYTTLISYIKLRYIEENKIINLYMEGKLFDVDFEKIAMEGIIGLDKYYDATSKRTKETLEENARIKFKPVLVNIPDKKVRVNLVEDGKEPEGSDTDIFRTSKNKTLIDPNARYEFLKLLGAKEAEAVILDEDNAFYNYEFFVIPDSQGNLQEDSVVIAERFYEDKEQMDKFATDNATYFFQYKDLMVNSNLSKKEMTQDRDNIVFTANHRVGSWAITVLYRIAQTMAGDNFKQYKRGDERAERILDELHKIYTAEEIRKILELAGRIDDTNEFIYEEINSVFGKRKENIEDDDGER